MQKVTSMVEYKHRHTVSVLRHLMRRAARGDLRGLAFCAIDSSNVEEMGFIGDYRENPGKALAVSLKMSWQLTRMQDEHDTRRD